MIKLGWVRSSINKHLGRIKRVFRWGVAKEMIPASVLVPLESAFGLAAGRTDASESEDEAGIDRCDRGGPQGRVVTDPGDDRPTGHHGHVARRSRHHAGRGDIDRTGTLWRYKPAHHKNAYRGDYRVSISANQEVLRPSLKSDPDACIFNPADSVAQEYAGRHSARKTPAGYGNSPGTMRIEHPCPHPGLRVPARPATG